MRATLALFATSVPAHVMFFMGSYDQLLVVLLLALALSCTAVRSTVIGVLLGLTHAEIGFVAAADLALLAAVGVGPRPRPRLFSLGGVLAGRFMVMVWLYAHGAGNDRFTFIERYGISRTLTYFMNTWWTVLWSILAGGWVILIAFMVRYGQWRAKAAVAAIVAVNIALILITVDQSRVAMLATVPTVIVLAVFARSEGRPTVSLPVAWAAFAVGMVAPLVVSLAGTNFTFGRPFWLGWL